MFLSNFFVVLLMSELILVYSSPHRGSGHSHEHPHNERENSQASITPSTTSTPSTTKCPKEIQIKGRDQDTLFPGCDWGEGGNEENNVDSSEDFGNRNGDEEIRHFNNSQQISSTKQNIASTQTTTEISTEQGPNTRQPGCTVLPNPGECRGAFPRFYFNEKLDQCDCFLYGGCGEELIMFTWLTLKECVNNCVPSNTIKGPGCQQVTFEEVERFTSEDPQTGEDPHWCAFLDAVRATQCLNPSVAKDCKTLCSTTGPTTTTPTTTTTTTLRPTTTTSARPTSRPIQSPTSRPTRPNATTPTINTTTTTPRPTTTTSARPIPRRTQSPTSRPKSTPAQQENNFNNDTSKKIP